MRIAVPDTKVIQKCFGIWNRFSLWLQHLVKKTCAMPQSLLIVAAAFGEKTCAMPRVMGSLAGEELARQIQVGCFLIGFLTNWITR
jgi:hypothetical protein